MIENIEKLNFEKYFNNVDKTHIFLAIVFFAIGFLSYILNDFLTTILRVIIELFFFGITICGFGLSGYYSYKIFKSININK